MQAHLIDVGGGRQLDVIDSGSGEAGTVVFHSGTPNGLVPFAPLAQGAAARQLRLIGTVRPGYGRSTPQPGRAIADVAADIDAVLDHLGIDTFVSLGHSGGGPHALACRALGAPRCAAAITIAGVGPYGADGLDFLAGMGEDNIDEFGAALQGEAPLTDYLDAFAGELSGIQPDGIVDSLASLLPEVDRTYLRGAFAQYLAEALRTSVANGIAGWRDDDVAFIRPWGFELTDLTNVSIWQGADDLMVPFAHGAWLAGTISASTPHLLTGEGHLSILVGKLDAILDEAMAYLD